MTRDRPKRRVLVSASDNTLALIERLLGDAVLSQVRYRHTRPAPDNERARMHDAMARPYSYRVARIARSHDTRRTTEEMAAQAERDR